ncbi:hypothetical protein SCUP515_00552 [Seiridium cupressi]
MFDHILNSVQTLSYSSLLGLAVVVGFAAANAKSLPLAYTLRLLPSLYQLLQPRLSSSKKSKSTTSSTPSTSHSFSAVRPALFKHNVMTSRAVAFDLDINVHKSNSTFFADADISRARLLAGLLSQSLAELGPANFILAGVQCKFQREIRPYQAYAVSSRILAWNDKTLYTVTYFLKPGTKLPFKTEVEGGPAALVKDEKLRRNIFATMVTKYVFKAGRTTVAPEHVFRTAGLIVDTEKGADAHNDGLLEADNVRSAVRIGLEYVTQSMD